MPTSMRTHLRRPSPASRCRVLHVINGEHYAGAERVQDLLAATLPELGFEAAVRGREARSVSGASPLHDRAVVRNADAEPMRSAAGTSVGRDRASREVRAHSHAHGSDGARRSVGGVDDRRADGASPAQSDDGRDDALVAESVQRGGRAGQHVSHLGGRSPCLRAWPVTAPSTAFRPSGSRSFTTACPSFANFVERSTPRGTWTHRLHGAVPTAQGSGDAASTRWPDCATPACRCDCEPSASSRRPSTNARFMRRVGELGVGDLIEWRGFQSDVAAEFAAMDLFVLPSLFGEGLPMVVLEAMSFGVPVVATRVEGVPEAIVDGVDGLHRPPGRPGRAGRSRRAVHPRRRRLAGACVTARDAVRSSTSPTTAWPRVRRPFIAACSRRPASRRSSRTNAR